MGGGEDGGERGASGEWGIENRGAFSVHVAAAMEAGAVWARKGGKGCSGCASTGASSAWVLVVAQGQGGALSGDMGGIAPFERWDLFDRQGVVAEWNKKCLRDSRISGAKAGTAGTLQLLRTS